MPSAKHVQHDIDASTEEKHQSNCFAKLGLKWSLGKYTESVNFLGLEVFLAPPTAWAARNQPRTPEN